MAELQHLRVSKAPLHRKLQAVWAVVRGALGVLLPLLIALSASSAWAAAPVRGVGPSLPIRALPIRALPAPSGPSAADDQAPMCDVHAASVAARAEVPEVDEGKLEPLSCEALLKLVGWGKELRELDGHPSVARHAAPQPEPARSSPLGGRPDGVIEQQGLLSMAYQTALVPDARLEGVSASPGHWRSVYRPPVARH